MAGRSEAKRLVGAERLRTLMVLRDGPGLVFAAGHLCALAATAAVLNLALGTIWVAPATVLHGIVIVHLFAPFHEATHGRAFRTPWLNRLLAGLTGWAIWLPPTHFTWEHHAHHTYTNDPERDPERIPMAESLGGYLLYATALPYFRSLFRTLFRFTFGRPTEEERSFLTEALVRRVRVEVLVFWTGCAVIAGLSVWAGSWAALIYWVIPRLAGEPFMRLIRMSEHVGRPLIPDLFRNTRTVLTWAPIRWLAWNNAFHAEHHAFPGVPFHALGRLHDLVAPRFEDVQRGYLRTQWVLMRNGLDRRAP